MKNDFFRDRKCVHIQLDKETHVKMRVLAFEKGITLQEAFEEFAKRLVDGDHRATRIVEAMIKRQLERVIAGLSRNEPRSENRGRKISELDHDALYGLIEEAPDETGGDDEAA